MMTAFRFAGFYPAQFNTPLGSAIVAPGQVVEWPDDGPPNEGHGWVETEEEPTPFEELGHREEAEENPTQDESEKDSGENMPENIPATLDAPDTSADIVSTQVSDTGARDTTDQPDSAPAPKRTSARANNK